MHSYILARGQLLFLKKFENDLAASSVPYTMRNIQKKMQIGVRPIKLYELAYPKELHEEVMRRIMPYNNSNKISSTINFLILPFLKAFGIRKNKVKSDGRYTHYGIMHDYVDVVVLGTKDDIIEEDYTQHI